MESNVKLVKCRGNSLLLSCTFYTSTIRNMVTSHWVVNTKRIHTEMDASKEIRRIKRDAKIHPKRRSSNGRVNGTYGRHFMSLAHRVTNKTRYQHNEHVHFHMTSSGYPFCLFSGAVFIGLLICARIFCISTVVRFGCLSTSHIDAHVLLRTTAGLEPRWSDIIWNRNDWNR